MPKELDPKEIDSREALDSDEHPVTTPVVVCFDVTGSMGIIPEMFAKELLGNLMDTLIDSDVTDPQICVVAVGDAYSDRAPLQILQFESDNRVTDHLKNIFLERGGGGTCRESYELAWYWFSNPDNTVLDTLARGEKGIFFTIGDEMAYENLPARIINKLTNNVTERDVSFAEIVKNMNDRFHAFHVMITEGCNYGADTKIFWERHLEERVISVDNYRTICDVIKGVCMMVAGSSIDEAIEVAENKGSASKALTPLAESGALVVKGKGTGRVSSSLMRRGKRSRRL